MPWRLGSNAGLDLRNLGETMLEVRAQREPWRDGVELMALVRDDLGTSVAKPLTLERIEEGTYVSEPTMRLTNQAAQMLMDELWRCGLRPSEGAGSAGSLAATERHLKDVRAVAMGLLRKDGVQV
jgi:hypothetical protein